ncbi:MAG: S-adenosylmethionine:tRNA ribosyltransferase-isomerase [Tannerellaceae bacterium]|jgi:S-adenosylmethionine:tRNA ribosyltransferase-isomerase|nr:S-adenosylmethionine:tRNA ribosyltransferase-isomerase [Tannerellaceae bacterium]
MEILHINISDYDYLLPEERIAKYPLPLRDSSKLLIYRNGMIEESIFSRIDEIIPAGSLLVMNDSRVPRLRLMMNKETGAKIEILCLEPVEPDTHASILTQKERCIWNCYVGNLSKWKGGTVCCSSESLTLTARLCGTSADMQQVEFTWNKTGYTFSDILEEFGSIPIPPYLNRKDELIDRERYINVYSEVYGSAAAPTAGFHFTEELLGRLKNTARTAEITLHVSASTFKPVQSPELSGHRMHEEQFFVKPSIINELLRSQNRTIAVGTTTLRALESLYHIGCYLSDHPGAHPHDLSVNQWQPYDTNNHLPAERALENILEYMNRRGLDELPAVTRILIAPGYEFKIAKGLITNFHQPRSTLLLLVSAFVDGNWRKIYDYALERDFRFLSYGDSSILLGKDFGADE